ncbi:lipopolysaccharide transport periplasmic protein LptA [Nitrosomonas supralitoralis]|uniref:Lipopolysaccharide export system protein LptA n=1 Tax=Nitrosomonas supralitoralis TaxID=2116706 RepID=A0A2P7NV88_9PROT|nr:lipopolysaccharide transport periplasmic protein LptA [Nitrosomonas supralitoralis]PSJ17386.1 lipopolysaccharide transport periplasmic protein LptA [Nitrosomonas supralitoralis]
MKLLIIISFVGLFFISNAEAERADREKPIHLEADRATVEDVNRKEGSRISIFTGNVIFTQGTLRIKADKVIMKEDSLGFRHATATGNLVSFRQKRDRMDEYVEGWSQRAEYDSKTEKIELFRQARLIRGEDEVLGDYISYDMNSEFFEVISSKERGVETGPDKRVRITIQPKNKSE